MRRLYYLIILSIVSGDFGFAQQTANYFPLDVGNRYHWYAASNCPPYIADTLNSLGWAIVDTVTTDRKLYYSFPLLYWGADTVRIDSTGNVLYRYMGQDGLFFKLNATLGETWQVVLPAVDYEPGTFNMTLESNSDTVTSHLGTFTKCMRFHLDNSQVADAEEWYWLAPDVGLVCACAMEARSVYEAVVAKDTLPRITSVKEPMGGPKSFVFYQNYPNPFNPTTLIKYRLVRFDHVVVQVFDLLGRYVRALVNEGQSPGDHIVVWDGKDNNGRLVPSGTYFCQIQVGNLKISKKLSLIR